MRGLLMVECLYHQTIKGLKTNTRRSGGLEQVNGSPEVKKKGLVVKPAIVTEPDFWELVRYNDHHAKFFKKFDALTEVYCKPRYKVGEVLYLKEPTAKAKIINDKQIYAYLYGCNGNKAMISEFKWENKLFMPENRARAFVRITGIRCERLLDISDEDCIAEGIAGVFQYTGVTTPMKQIGWRDYLSDHAFENEGDSFFSLFRFANKISPKKDIGNPWVWVYEIEYLPNYKPE